jgi:PEP-CTERM motif-containing protein
MNSKRILFVVLLMAAPLVSADVVRADNLTAVYTISLSLQSSLGGLKDGNGNSLTKVPSDLKIFARTIDVSGSGFFPSMFPPSPNTESSFTASGDVIVAGAPQGDGPLTIGLGDGHVLSSTASGSAINIIGSPHLLFASDVSQFGEIAFINSSASTTYFADIVMTWTFDVTMENNSLPISNLTLNGGYIVSFAECCGPDFFLDDGLSGLVNAGEERHISGSHTFSVVFEVPPGGQSALVARTFVGAIGAANVPEPSTLALLSLGASIVMGSSFRRRYLTHRTKTTRSRND